MKISNIHNPNYYSIPVNQRLALEKNVFSSAAAKRILGIVNSTYIKIRTDFAYVCWVWAPGRRPMFVSKVKFVIDYIQSRHERSTEKLRAMKKNNYHCVISSHKDNGIVNIYHILMETPMTCTCADFEHKSRSLVFVSAMRNYIPNYQLECKHIIFTKNNLESIQTKGAA